ncbi:MAG: PEP-CTERM sorting domain-containing protein [Opitutales bacterium]|nr:PEP-CTERM sorting domain-containing protein [Opitutales bacterium]
MKSTLITTLAVAGLALSASAVPFSFTYTDTVSSSTFSEVSPGDAARIVIVVDNGNSVLENQTWALTDVVSVSFDFGNGAITATFNIPDDNGLDSASSGSITSDATGTLTSFFTQFKDRYAISDFSSNYSAEAFAWFVNGGNQVFSNRNDTSTFLKSVSLTNVGNNINPAYWTVAAVPEPATYAGIVGLGALALAVARRRKV